MTGPHREDARMPPADGAFTAMVAARISGDTADDTGTRSTYASDASNHRVVPRCVAFPRSSDDVAAIVDLCRAEGVPITSRGAGTSIAGSAIGSGVVVDFHRYLGRVLSVDPDARVAVVEPGVVLDTLQRQVSARGLRFGPDPSTHDRCTVGGMLGTNACGAHSVAWGTTSANTLGLGLVLADGTRVRVGEHRGEPSDLLPRDLERRLRSLRDTAMPAIRTRLGRFPRQISGYPLQHLLTENGFDVAKALVGTEGTCALITSATLALVPLPEVTRLVVVGCRDIVHAAAVAARLVLPGLVTIEGLDTGLLAAYESRSGPGRRPEMPAGGAWLLVEAGAAEGDIADVVLMLRRAAQDAGAVDVHEVTDPALAGAIWLIREKGAGLATRLPDGRECWPGWEDAAVPVEALATYLAEFRRLLVEHGRDGVVYGHFGEGCVHVRIDHDLLTSAGRADYRRFQSDAADLVVRHHGSLTGEHGDGRARSALLSRMYGEELRQAFAAFKSAFDPTGLLNPGVIVDPVDIDDHLRDASGSPRALPLAFTYPDDDGDLHKALRRCVGVGACRAPSGGMCPSYTATADDRHSTRGRARILADLLEGRLERDDFDNPAVEAALDLCLMCKACGSECPVSVDMATYKAEYLHQRYRGHRRPRAHYSMGWLPLWLALARRAPALGNRLIAGNSSHRALAKLAGLDPDRGFPQLAAEPVRRRRLAGRSRGIDRAGTRANAAAVLVWMDTFTSSFDPQILDDVVAVLRAAGFSVDLVGAGRCCGLTWISTGQLDMAKHVLGRAIGALDRAGDRRPIVVLEPSCASALRDESVSLLGTPAASRVAARVVGLADLLHDRELPGAPALVESGSRPTAVVQYHCHQRATVGTQVDQRLLARLGFEAVSVDEGCCGLAGNFGFEPGHRDVSRQCAEQSFRPYLVRDPAATVIADGFSCRTQIAQLGQDALGNRLPVHLATLLAERLRGSPLANG